MGRLEGNMRTMEEATEFGELVSPIMKNCQPFLKDIAKGRYLDFLYSGRKITQDFFERGVRSDRKPTDTHMAIHNDLNKAFERRFGYPARSHSVFTTGSMSDAEQYGTPYAIFPLGKYKFLWHPDVGDLYLELTRKADGGIAQRLKGNPLLNHFRSKYKMGATYKTEDEYDRYLSTLSAEEQEKASFVEWIKARNEVIEERGLEDYNEYIEELVAEYTDKSLVDAMDSQHEIMLTCKRYYGLNARDHAYDFEMYLRKFGTKGHKSNEEIHDWWVNDMRKR